ncbi:MAG TPA: NUDIX hydrolase, partial [Patescibacteria group bacterium]|nr:NUDIX hydrolase [Patescibacteria group bacterium]
DPNGGGVYLDCWHIPGGGVDEGETKEEALVREIKEETGVDISPYEIKLVDDLGEGKHKTFWEPLQEMVMCKMKFNVYKVEINGKLASEINISLDDDLIDYQWADIKDLKNIKLTPPSVELFKRMGYL